MKSSPPSVAAAFGAQINLSEPDAGLYLVVGRAAPPNAQVRLAGGQVVMSMPGTSNLLALLPTTGFLSLRGHRDIAHIGPITIDSTRFNQFLEALGLNNPAQ